LERHADDAARRQGHTGNVDEVCNFCTFATQSAQIDGGLHTT
jgi:hypothetical protein